MKITTLSPGVCIALTNLSHAEHRIRTRTDGRTAKLESFKSRFDHGVNGIPCVVACELQGKVLAQTQTLAQLKTLLK